MKSSLPEVLRNDGIRINIKDTYEVYAAVWESFRCETCGREEFYRDVKAKFNKERWIPEAAGKAKADGWHVGPWADDISMDCTAYCPDCRSKAKV